MTASHERTIHRLEAFSDIVMGFCMAEIGLSLVIPKSVAELATMWTYLNAFAFSFVMISMLWWYHHRLFVTYFTLNGATIAMNFTLLASLVFGIYFQQVAIHFLTAGLDPVVPLRLWLGCMAVVFLVLAGMYALGIWERRDTLDASSLRWGVNLNYQAAVSAVGLTALCLVGPLNLKAALAVVIVVGLASALSNRIVSRFTRALSRSDQ